jgi:hypothetical protein
METAAVMDRAEFLHHMERIAPGPGLGPDDPLADLAPYRRLVITRWLADALEQPTDLEVVQALPTLAAAWGVARGGRPRRRAPADEPPLGAGPHHPGATAPAPR